MLEKGAQTKPDEEFVFFADEAAWTRRYAVEAAYGAANVLRQIGVRQGDRVSIFLPNGSDFLRAWWGAVTLGAVVVPINTGFKGKLLANQIDLTSPSVLITDDSLGARIDDAGVTVDYTQVHVRVLGTGADVHTPPPLDRPISHADTEFLILTSGTTGPSKLVPQSYMHCFLGGEPFVAKRNRGYADCFLVDTPMYHSTAMYMSSGALYSGARIAVREYPAMSTYWEVARDTGATLSVLMSTMVSFLEAQDPRPAEKEHNLQSVCAGPVPKDAKRFMDRFNIPEIVTGFGMSEFPAATVSDPRDDLTPGYLGRVREGFEIRVVDEHDNDVPVGQAGEMVVRTDRSGAMMLAYEKNPEATERAWRNGWFHSGDMVRVDEDGRYFYVDRIKDALRRRGENISSAEVEEQVRSHPSVSEAVCVPHRADGQIEDEVKVWVVLHQGESFDPESLFHHCVERLPYFMVPRFFEPIGELPRTGTGKIRKMELRLPGNGAATWDSEEVGYRLTRKGLVTRDSIS